MKLLMLSVLILLVSCSKDECSDTFKRDYNDMTAQFKNLYKEGATQEELASFKGSMTTFLSSHKGVKCEINKEEVDPTAEIEATIAELDKSMKIVIKVVYGKDNRVDIVDSPVARYREWADSTAAHIGANELDSSYNIKSDSLGLSIGLCPGERFYSQLSAARCSGFLVGTDTLVTAGHCMQYTTDCTNYLWAFGFYKGVTQLKEEDIYRCKSVIKQELLSNGLDYAVVKLDRPVVGRKFFNYRTSGKIADGQNLVVIGYPSGLPAKIADGAAVRDNDNANWFSSNLDTFGGNSGSAVINANTGIVEGILVRGETDYAISSYNGSTCYKVNVCSDSGCGGEEVTRMTSVQGIPSILDANAIADGLFKSKNLPIVDSGARMETHGYSYNNYIVAGRKFLSVCGSHVYQDGQTKWITKSVGDCGSQSAIIEFLRLIRL